jgi:hypothetical protein
VDETALLQAGQRGAGSGVTLVVEERGDVLPPLGRSAGLAAAAMVLGVVPSVGIDLAGDGEPPGERPTLAAATAVGRGGADVGSLSMAQPTSRA